MTPKITMTQLRLHLDLQFNALGPANELLSELLRNYTVIPFGD